MPNFKVFKDRVTLLVDGNVAGYKLKLFLINRFLNPLALRNVNKRANLKAWMTQALRI